MKTILTALCLLLAASVARADEWEPRISTPWPTGRPGGRDVYSERECRPVLIRRTTIYVDQFGYEVYRSVSYRRAMLCESPRFCRECRE